MTTIDYHDLPMEAPATRRRPFAALRSWFAQLQRQSNERHTRKVLSQLDARLLRDIGINPMDVRDAYDGRSGSILFDPIRRYESDQAGSK